MYFKKSFEVLRNIFRVKNNFNNCFKGKNVFITGGSSGIGLATAEQFSNLGSNICIIARNKSKLESALKEIQNRKIDNNQKFIYSVIDVTNYENVKNGIKKAINEIGAPYILINCAGMSYPNYYENISNEKFDAILKTNLYGTHYTIRTILPYMKKDGGYIINVSSVAGFVGVFGFTAYSASKFAVIGFSECLRSELKKYNINVSVLCPPDTDTPMFHEENKIKPPETKAISETAKVLSPEYVSKYLVKKIIKGKFMIIPGIESKFVYLVKRIAPGLIEYINDKKINKIQNS